MFQINTHYVQDLSCRFSGDALVIESRSFVGPDGYTPVDSEFALFFESSTLRGVAIRQLIDSLQELLPRTVDSIGTRGDGMWTLQLSNGATVNGTWATANDGSTNYWDGSGRLVASGNPLDLQNAYGGPTPPESTDD